MKKLLLLVFVAWNTVHAQQFNFDKRAADALDKWVVFDKNDSDTTYAFGFIYVDLQAGFTFNYETRLSVENGKLKKQKKDDMSSLKYRLDVNARKVHILSDEQIKQLQLPNEPDWLAIYKSEKKDLSYLKNMGRHYNHIGAIDKSIPLLQKAYAEDPHFVGLEFELAYAYNANGQFDQAIEILNKAIKNDAQNFWFYRELGFSYIRKSDIEKAEEIYRKGISISNDPQQKAEMAINMVQGYFMKKNRVKFDEWAHITRQYTPKGSQFDQFIDLFINKWNEKQ